MAADGVIGTSFVERTLGRLRSFVDHGQGQLGGPGSRANGIVKPRQSAAPVALPPEADEPDGTTVDANAADHHQQHHHHGAGAETAPDVNAHASDHQGAERPSDNAIGGKSKGGTKGGGVGGDRRGAARVVVGDDDRELSPRSAHARAAAEHSAAESRAAEAQRARHECERKEKLTRYIILIVCVVTIILSIIGMSAISRKVIGKWWHGAPDPAPTKISHSPIFPNARSI